MTVEIKEIASRSNVETAEDDLPAKLQPSGISSEIDYLKRLKLRTQIQGNLKAISETEAEAKKLPEYSIATFKSAEDARIEKYYSKLISIYKRSVVEKPENETAIQDKLTAKMELAYLYSIYGYKNLYQLAHDLSEVERVQNSNEEIKNLSKTLNGLK